MISFDKTDIFLVTGASSGIGQGITWKLNELGATVIAVGRNEERLQETKQKSAYSENIFLEIKDLTENIDLLPDWVTSLKNKYGKLKGLVCSAGIVNVSPLKTVTEKNIKSLFDINYFTNIFLAKGVADKRNNIGDGTSIIFIGSAVINTLFKGQLAYAASKAALVTSAQIMANELLKNNIRVNAISPGDINTPMLNYSKIQHNYSVQKYKIGESSDVAKLTAFLLSDSARWITGQNYVIDGGAYLR